MATKSKKFLTIKKGVASPASTVFLNAEDEALVMRYVIRSARTEFMRSMQPNPFSPILSVNNDRIRNLALVALDSMEKETDDKLKAIEEKKMKEHASNLDKAAKELFGKGANKTSLVFPTLPSQNSDELKRSDLGVW